jgi:hypothetical protein
VGNTFLAGKAGSEVSGGSDIFLCGNDFGNSSGSSLKVSTTADDVEIQHNSFMNDIKNGIVAPEGTRISSNSFGADKRNSSGMSYQNQCTRD